MCFTSHLFSIPLSFCLVVSVLIFNFYFIAQPSASQTIKGSSNSVWHVAVPLRMEKVTAPGISHASITHCQDWRRLLCQNNNVDIHHERPSPQHPHLLSLSTTHPNQSVCVCVHGLSLLPACPLWNKSSQVFISCVLSVSLLQYWLSLSWLDQLLAPTCLTRFTPGLTQCLEPTPSLGLHCKTISSISNGPE